MKKARPNSVSVLPTHSQFKDKPVGSASGAPGNTARWTLRRVILGAGGLLFVYITLTTIFKSSSSTGRSPRVTRPEPDFYKDVQLNNGKPYKDANPVPIIDNDNKPWLDPSNNKIGDSIGGAEEVKKPEQEPIIEDKTPKQPEKQQPPAGGSRSGSEQTAEEGDDADTDLDELEVESDVSITSRKRLSTGVTYAQVLASTRAERDYAIALIVKEANQALKSTEVYSVTNKDQTAPSNDIHDYLSLSKYYWPNDKSPTGDFLPYVRRDGHINPEIETVRDYRLLRTMMREVHIMGMAYHFTGNKTYADKCAKRLREWFLDEATYMNPNINFGSLRKGEALGARTGVLDMFPIFRVFDALHYLKQEPSWDPTLIPQLQEWFTRYVRWLETATLAKVERKGNNNHGTYYDVQIIGIYLFLDRIDDAREVARSALENRIDRQILPDGGQPEELERKTSWYYSVFNLQALMTLARWGDDLGVNMWDHEGPKGQSIKKAIDFLLPYSLKNGEGWPVKNLKGFDMTDYLKCLQIAWNIYGDQKYLDAITVIEPKVRQDMVEGKIKTISTFMCDMSTLMEAGQRGGQGMIWHWCLT
ncbi:hypothetical protein BG006_008412 [Podila minutissima]|uniref:Alginate lyase domain-containing protein n=1 Tax=Podila minutissima TaxID=64525 RepID=A0A9P5SVQ6_9FUNG|nr:hypothetical protein BG006_008412 [Podila minutissima]